MSWWLRSLAAVFHSFSWGHHFFTEAEVHECTSAFYGGVLQGNVGTWVGMEQGLTRVEILEVLGLEDYGNRDGHFASSSVVLPISG